MDVVNINLYYECEILQNLDKKLLAKALRKVDAN